jgi:hypothetical protein
MFNLLYNSASTCCDQKLNVNQGQSCSGLNTFRVMINFTDHSIIHENPSMPLNSKQELDYLEKLIMFIRN